MSNEFFERPILNSPYEYPGSHWELDGSGQPTGKIITSRRRAEFITPIPKPRKQKGRQAQQSLGLDHGAGISDAQQEYEKTATVINELRAIVDAWRELKDSSQFGGSAGRAGDWGVRSVRGADGAGEGGGHGGGVGGECPG